MPVLQITNTDPSTRVWLDARFSNGGVPFDELVQVPGFPRWITKDDTITIEMSEWTELLYRRSIYPAVQIEDNLLDKLLLTDLYRIGMSSDRNVRNFIWPLPLFPRDDEPIGPATLPSASELKKSHWLMGGDDVLLKFVKEKCGADDKEIEIVRREFLIDKVRTMIALKSKVRTVKNHLIEPYIKVAGYGVLTLQVFVKLMDLSTKRTGKRMIIETNPYEAMSLIDKFIIKKDNLVAKPRTTKWGYTYAEVYRSRGFRVPINEPINNFFSCAPASSRTETAEGKNLLA